MRGRLAEQFEDYLRKRMAQGCTNGKVLFREVQGKGYEGAFGTFKHFLKPQREQDGGGPR